MRFKDQLILSQLTGDGQQLSVPENPTNLYAIDTAPAYGDVYVDPQTGEPRKEPPKEAGPPDRIYTGDPRRDVVESAAQFQCAGPDGSFERTSALQRIPRAPVILRAEAMAEMGDDFDLSASFDSQRAAEGMYLCELEGNVEVVSVSPPPDTELPASFMTEVMRSVRYTLEFRSQDVAGADYIRLGEIMWSPECCGDVGRQLGFVMPRHGELRLRVEGVPMVPEGFAVTLKFSASIRASGCPCPDPQCCGCS